jgi:hypothetical protein
MKRECAFLTARKKVRRSQPRSAKASDQRKVFATLKNALAFRKTGDKNHGFTMPLLVRFVSFNSLKYRQKTQQH